MLDRREHAIRERAYAIYENEGLPDGQELDHWLRAEAEILAGMAAGERLTPHPTQPDQPSPSHAQPALTMSRPPNAVIQLLRRTKPFVDVLAPLALIFFAFKA